MRSTTAVANYNQTVLDALRDVADQVNAVRSLAQQAQSQQQAVDTARAAFDLAQQRYRAGIGSYGRADRAVHAVAVAAAAGRPAVAAGADLGAPEQGAGRWFSAR